MSNSKRPELTIGLKREDFLNYYYLKEELTAFCRENGLPISGGKLQITERIAHFLESGEILAVATKKSGNEAVSVITPQTIIEENITCSQIHRAFFKEHIKKNFSFNVIFQEWLKNNAGKTYQDAIEAYDQIIEDKKKNKTVIDKQFEYNTYIRAFFEDNQGRTLKEAIQCWNYKKSQKGHNRYEKKDLCVLQ